MRGSSEHEAASTAGEEEKAPAAHPDRFNFGGRKVSDVLLARLSEMSASAPQLLDAKKLDSSDARRDQNRLQFSALSPISRAFTDAEMPLVKSEACMPVRVYDCEGRQYEMKCRLWNEKHYRFRGDGWTKFKDANDLMIPKGAELTRHVTVEVWAFRSRALPPPPTTTKDYKDYGGGHPHLHPNGTLGLVLLVLFQEEEEAAAVHADGLVRKFLEAAAAFGLLALRNAGRDQTKRKREDD
ncbi:hypothetical protein BS78_03G271100 [Paspalum vaginatum]|nr:hypothetical protein BS78_03G271100 [Paspalum vaginatum]